MKLLMTVLVALIAGPAFAGQAQINSTTWDEIQSNKSYFVDGPSVAFRSPAGEGLVFVRLVDTQGFANACIAGEKLYAGETSICLKRAGNADAESNGTCLKSKVISLYADISGVRRICVEKDDDNNRVPRHECTKWAEFNYTIDTNVKTAVYKEFMMSDEDKGQPQADDEGFLGWKRQQLSACGE